jgi:hypothetical protein
LISRAATEAEGQGEVFGGRYRIRPGSVELLADGNATSKGKFEIT